MILELKPMTTEEEQFELIQRLEQMGFQVARQGAWRLAIVRGVDKLVQEELFVHLPFVKRVLRLEQKYKLNFLVFMHI